MVCKLDRPSPQALFDKTRGLFEANVLGGYDVIPESVEWYVVANDYAMQEEFYSIAEAQWKARDPRYMCCADLVEYAAQFGFSRNDALSSQGYIRLSGIPGTTIPDSLEVTINGLAFLVEGAHPAVMPGVGYVDLRVKAVVPGADSNIAIKNSSGTLSNAPAGLNSRVTVFGSSFCGGADAEDCEAFRDRFIERMAYKPRANSAWMEETLKTWPCVTRVCERGGSCCTVRTTSPDCTCSACGCNSCTQALDYYVFFDGTFDCGIPPACVITDMNVWMFGDPVGKGLGQAEIGICGQIYAPVASMINVNITGIQCASATEIQQVKDRVADVFLTFCPSQFASKRSVELAIAQVVGVSYAFDVVFEDLTGNMSFSPCGDMDPECDIMPCLNDVIIIGADASINSCNGN